MSAALGFPIVSVCILYPAEKKQFDWNMITTYVWQGL